MAIDWSNEPYARLYKRETDDDLLLSWEAEAVWHKFIKRCDRSGMLETRRGVQGIAALLRIPLDVVERVLPELLEDGRLRSIPNVGMVAPNYVEANDTPRSNKARQAEVRIRRKNDALSGQSSVPEDNATSRDVTERNAESRDVTQYSTDQSRAGLTGSPSATGDTKLNEPTKPERRKHRISADWQPNDRERQSAKDKGLNCDAEAEQFRDHHTAKGEPMLDWDAAFRTWLRNAVRFSGRSRQASFGVEQPIRKVKDL